jgi:hypothetical protein
MSVQFAPGGIKDENNGLAAMTDELLDFSDADRVVAIVTYKVTKKTQDVEKGEDYPVLKITHIEPVRSEQNILQVQEIASAEHQTRTGDTSLDLGLNVEDGAE